MRQFSRSSSLFGLSSVCLSLWGACATPMDVLDGDNDKRRDLAKPRLDLAIVDLAPGPVDMGGADLRPDLRMPADLSVPPDLRMPGDFGMPMDLGMAPDLAGIYSCRGTDAPGMTYKLVTDTLKLPKSTGVSTYAYDYDGDGKPENQLKNLINVIAIAGIDVQISVDMAVVNGASLQLARVTTSDLKDSSCAGMTLVPAKTAMSPPKFDGSDLFEKLMSPESTLIGAISSFKLTTKASKDLMPTEDSPLNIHLTIGPVTMAVPLHGVHIEGTIDNSGTPLRIKDGGLYAVIAAADIDLSVIPAMAGYVTNLINSDPMSDLAKALIGLFESLADPVTKTKCMVSSMCCHRSPATCVILPQEVKDSVIGGILAPDVQVFDLGGAWKPVAGGKAYNGMSFGIGFSAVTASFP